MANEFRNGDKNVIDKTEQKALAVINLIIINYQK